MDAVQIAVEDPRDGSMSLLVVDGDGWRETAG